MSRRRSVPVLGPIGASFPLDTHPHIPTGLSVIPDTADDSILDGYLGVERPSCPICFEEFKAGDRIAVTSCRHGFHASCLAGWLKKEGSCPMCRKNIANTFEDLREVLVPLCAHVMVRANAPLFSAFGTDRAVGPMLQAIMDELRSPPRVGGRRLWVMGTRSGEHSMKALAEVGQRAKRNIPGINIVGLAGHSVFPALQGGEWAIRFLREVMGYAAPPAIILVPDEAGISPNALRSWAEEASQEPHERKWVLMGAPRETDAYGLGSYIDMRDDDLLDFTPY